jgi:DNA-binding beta-propeller fold protein YncE
MKRFCACICAIVLVAGIARADLFINWETPHVHPLDMTPDGARLLAVNTPDNRLEVFDISTGLPVLIASIPVGLDPVSVRARTNNEVWVVNHISDSVSIVDLAASNVVETLRTDDEPCDVVFAGSPSRAFVSCSQANTVLVFDPAATGSAPTRIAIEGEDPRAMAVSPAGDTVYVAVFESGNRTTILGGGNTSEFSFPPNAVNNPAGPYGGVNPPPNDGAAFKPPVNPANPAPPRVGLIVRKNSSLQWMDDNLHDWTDFVTGPGANLSGRPEGWDLLDHDVAIIDTASQSVSYATGLMNLCMAVAVNPATGEVSVVGTDATNEVRYEPVVNGRFLRVNFARFAPASPALASIADLNPHLIAHYGTDIPFVPIAQTERDKSLGDPRAITWNAAGTLGYVAGMGSNNIVVIDPNGDRIAAPPIEVGEGPTGLAFDAARNRFYVLNKFSADISTVDVVSNGEILPRAKLHDPSGPAIKIGRKHLYNTHSTSGLGHIACASCHVDARMDRLSWDLGNPAGTMSPFDQNCMQGSCQPWHPMKGPMTTQTLQDIIGKEPHHWRGDKDGLEEFAGAFQNLQGADAPLPPAEMQEFENFLATIYFPPNPFRNFDGSLPASLDLPGHFTTGIENPAGLPLPPGNAEHGLQIFSSPTPQGLACIKCHSATSGLARNTGFAGGEFFPIPPGPNGEEHHGIVADVDGITNETMKVPQLRNMYEKVGFEVTQTFNVAGFGFMHDGAVDAISRFLVDRFPLVTSDQSTADLVALLLCFSGDEGQSILSPQHVEEHLQNTHAAVGRQTTVRDGMNLPAGQSALLADMLALANKRVVGLVAKGKQGSAVRGYFLHTKGRFQSDRLAQKLSAAALFAAASPGSELTFTVVPAGAAQRIGVDRDSDGFFDRDELDAGSDPADPASTPGNPLTAAKKLSTAPRAKARSNPKS